MRPWQFFRRRKAAPAASFRHLRAGAQYHVIRTFHDFDGIEHPRGESWTFSRFSYLSYEDGLSLFVVSSEGQECQIRLQARPDTQGPIIDHLETYISEGRAMRLIRVTRDSVGMADDVDAPHEQLLEFSPDTDARGVASRLLSGSYLPYVGSTATWMLALGKDYVVFGVRRGRRFVLPIDPKIHKTRVATIDAIRVGYATQGDPMEVAAKIRRQSIP